MKPFIKSLAVVSLLALSPTAANASPGGASGSPILCPMGQQGSIFNYVLIPCVAHSLVVWPY